MGSECCDLVDKVMWSFHTSLADAFWITEQISSWSIRLLKDHWMSLEFSEIPANMCFSLCMYSLLLDFDSKFWPLFHNLVEWNQAWFLEVYQVNLQLLPHVVFVHPLYKIGVGESATPRKQKDKTSEGYPSCLACLFVCVLSLPSSLLISFMSCFQQCKLLYLMFLFPFCSRCPWSLFPCSIHSIPRQFVGFSLVSSDILHSIQCFLYSINFEWSFCLKDSCWL